MGREEKNCWCLQGRKGLRDYNFSQGGLGEEDEKYEHAVCMKIFYRDVYRV